MKRRVRIIEYIGSDEAIEQQLAFSLKPGRHTWPQSRKMKINVYAPTSSSGILMMIDPVLIEKTLPLIDDIEDSNAYHGPLDPTTSKIFIPIERIELFGEVGRGEFHGVDMTKGIWHVIESNGDNYVIQDGKRVDE